MKEQRFSTSINCFKSRPNMFGNHATSVTYYESKDLTHDFEYPEKWKKFISVNWTTKEDDKDFVAGTLTLKQRV